MLMNKSKSKNIKTYKLVWSKFRIFSQDSGFRISDLIQDSGYNLVLMKIQQKLVTIIR